MVLEISTLAALCIVAIVSWELAGRIQQHLHRPALAKQVVEIYDRRRRRL